MLEALEELLRTLSIYEVFINNQQFFKEMQQGYFEVDNSSASVSGRECCNSTPFSVKDILNIVDQNDDHYMGCHIERCDLMFLTLKRIFM